MITCKLFRDKDRAAEIRVEAFDEDGDRETAVFTGSRAVERATEFARFTYGRFEDLDNLME
jgi:hypothetical protein